MNQTRSPRRRALSLLLALALVLGLLPSPALAAEGGTETGTETAPAASAAPADHWAASYLNQLVEWGFIRADQAQNPDKQLTRADFMSIVNRAYGYHEAGETPFEDVSEYDWFYDDVGIAYTARYIHGTSPTTASPNDPLNRETAATILGRNMMLQESPGELMDFSDARDISNWARGTIKSSMEHYLVNGYDDGTFRPQKAMTWGEIAAMVTRTVGTPLQDEGDYSLGGVFGNVTITSPGVTLRDTVISGDLYVTGGVGLGGVKLENVTVLGRIIASGTGTSEGGASILLRNVTADELLVDNLQDNEVSIQADGITEIGKTTVRTSAYIEDNTPDGMGLHMISLEGDSYGEDEEPPEGWEPPRLTLAGRVEEVVNRTPDSTIHAAKGTVAKLTVDETATGSHVDIDRGAVVKNLILDASVDVTGEGDVTHLEVNAPDCTVEMLPDEIVIRPGITAIIAGEEMDSTSADEFLLEPMILSGYPKAQDIAPTSLEAVFATNKKGRIYWAVSAITDGSIGADDLIKPPSYGNKAVKWGTIDSPRGNEEVIAQITGLTSNGSYYLSAVLEDAKGQLSPVKVISFTTPDNTVPAFNTGYPRMSKVSPKDSMVVVSTNKSCKLYYALLPEGATAPTENELKTNAVAGALGYGVRDVQKNVEDTFRVNDQILKEKTNYILYLWLVDADGANKSAIITLPFTTDDETPPEFVMGPEVSSVQATSVGLRFRLSEDGTVYWVAVPAGTVYPKPQPGTEYDRAPLTSDYAKLQVASGMNLGTDGRSGQVTARELVDGTINVTGLQAEKAYDFYYVAKDNAGPDRNYSVTVGKMTINTLDNTGPKFSQHFSKTSGTDDTIDPLSSTDIYLDVTENIRYSGDGGGRGFLELFEDGTAASKRTLAANLAASIKLFRAENTGDDDPQITIDYSQATIKSTSGGGIRITIPNAALTPALANGSEYYFTIQNITDTSNNFNPLAANNPGFIVDFKHNEVASRGAGHNVPPFVVEFARVWFTDDNRPKDTPQKTVSGTAQDVPIDFFFRLRPEGTKTTANDMCYDLILWSDTIADFDLYYRIVDKDLHNVTATTDKKYWLPENSAAKDGTPDTNGWIYLGNTSTSPKTGSWDGKSVNTDRDFNDCDSTNLPSLNTLSEDIRYEFVVSLTGFKGDDDSKRDIWTGDMKLQANVAAGPAPKLELQGSKLGTYASSSDWETAAKADGVRSIGRWIDADNNTVFTFQGEWSRTDTGMPEFFPGAPTFVTESDKVDMILNITSKGEIHYGITKVNSDTQRPMATATRRLTDKELKAITDNNIPDADIPWSSKANNEIYVSLKDVNGIDPVPPDGVVSMPDWMKGYDWNRTGPGKTPEDGSTIVDAAAKKNLVESPTDLNIARPEETWNQSGQLVDHGTVSHPGKSDLPTTIKDLEPNTDYIVYFVIENGNKDRSHVYMYHFKTEEVSKPQINIANDDGNAKIWVHDMPSEYTYRVYATGVIANLAPFNEPFINYLDDTGKYIPLGKEFPDFYRTKSDGTPMTVLDAMVQDYAYGTASRSTNADKAYFPSSSKEGLTAFDHGASVFDIYADHDLRARVDEIVRQANGEGAVSQWRDTGTNTITVGGKAGEVTQSLKRIEKGTTYVILVVAQANSNNPTQPGSSDLSNAGRDAFRAFPTIQKSAGLAPNLQNASIITPITNLGANPDPAQVKKGPYSGKIRLTFDKALYREEPPESTTYIPVDGSYFSQGTGTAGVSVTPATPGRASTSFELEFSNLATVGSTININSRDRFRNDGGEPADEDLSITLERFYKEEPDPTDTQPDRSKQVPYLRLHVKWGISKEVNTDFVEFFIPEEGYREETVDGSGSGTTTPVKDFKVCTANSADTELASGATHSCTYDFSLNVGSTQHLYAILDPVKGTDFIQVSWSADPSGVINFDDINQGHELDITAQKIGTTKLTAVVNSNGKMIRKTIYVTVKGELGQPAPSGNLPENVSWDSTTSTAILQRDTSHSGFNVKFDVPVADMNNTTAKLTASIKSVEPKDPGIDGTSGVEKNPISCSVNGKTITIIDSGESYRASTGKQHSEFVVTIEVDIVSANFGNESLLKDGATGKKQFMIHVKGNQSNLNAGNSLIGLPEFGGKS